MLAAAPPGDKTPSKGSLRILKFRSDFCSFFESAIGGWLEEGRSFSAPHLGTLDSVTEVSDWISVTSPFSGGRRSSCSHSSWMEELSRGSSSSNPPDQHPGVLRASRLLWLDSASYTAIVESLKVTAGDSKWTSGTEGRTWPCSSLFFSSSGENIPEDCEATPESSSLSPPRILSKHSMSLVMASLGSVWASEQAVSRLPWDCGWWYWRGTSLQVGAWKRGSNIRLWSIG